MGLKPLKYNSKTHVYTCCATYYVLDKKEERDIVCQKCGRRILNIMWNDIPHITIVAAEKSIN